MKRLIFISVIVLFVWSFTFAESVAWEDQVIYFLMTDRFANGDPSNDVQTASGIDFGLDGSKYTGGDLQGLIDRLDYIQGLGVTTIWLTPPVANQWWDPYVNYGGYHGYWARDMKAIDEHFGDIQLYRRFIDEVHKRGMYVIQDIVCNHMGNHYIYNKDSEEYTLNTGTVPSIVEKPLQEPFDQIDFNDARQREAAIYHWESEQNPPTKENMGFADLDDLNTENQVVIDALKDSFKFWIDLGVDGYRIDTAIYIEDEFWKKFLEDDDGILPFAAKTGKENFIVYGEAWVTPPPFENNAEKLVSGYFDLGYNSMLDFPLMSEIHRVFKEGKPTDLLRYRLEQREAFFDGRNMITFVDNHDMSRFLKGAKVLDLMQALGLIFTIPGIPTIYYGTEQGFTETRASMFGGGYDTETDQYDPENALYKYIQELSALRMEYDAFRNGKVKVLYADTLGPGVLIYEIVYEEETYMVFMNTNAKAKYASDFDTGLPQGTLLEPVFTSRMVSKDIQIGKDGILNKLVDPKAFAVFRVTNRTKALKDKGIRVSFNAYEKMQSSDFTISGKAENAKKVKLFVDGNEKEYATMLPDDQGNWEATIRLADFISGTHKLFAKAYGKIPINYEYSDTIEIDMEIPIVELANFSDPVGDDNGPTGDYTYPKGEGNYRNEMDLTNVRFEQVGQILRMEFKMKDISDRWAPTNGFDHTVFKIYFDNPEKSGVVELPEQKAQMPFYTDGTQGNWDYQIYATGWSLTTYNSEGADAEAYGTPVTPSPEVKTDKDNLTITILVPLDSLDTKTLEGWTVYVTTYDYDGIESLLRRTSPNPGKWEFGAPSKNAPRIMDDILLEF
jgi:glycosidase